MDAVRAIELGAILRRIEIGPDAEITLGNRVNLHRQRLRLFALPLGLPFGRDLSD